MYRKKIIAVCFILFVLTASIAGRIGEGKSIEREQALKELIKEGKYPKLDRSESILGEDKDENGIRDDIDAYIDSLPDTPEQKGALRQTAEMYQTMLKIDYTNVNEVAKFDKKLDEAIHCITKQYDAPGHIFLSDEKFDFIKAITLNTKERSMRYFDFNENMAVTTSRMSEGGCDEKFIK